MFWLRRRLKGWRTVAFGFAVGVYGLLVAFQGVDFTPLLGEYANGVITSLIGITVILLRFVTTTAVGVEKPPEPDWEDGEPRQ
jgi:uncharacterized membrane protein HdeD (DUF308 family)